jgi:hypothetical protein
MNGKILKQRPMPKLVADVLAEHVGVPLSDGCASMRTSPSLSFHTPASARQARLAVAGGADHGQALASREIEWHGLH